MCHYLVDHIVLTLPTGSSLQLAAGPFWCNTIPFSVFGHSLISDAVRCSKFTLYFYYPRPANRSFQGFLDLAIGNLEIKIWVQAVHPVTGALEAPEKRTIQKRQN